MRAKKILKNEVSYPNYQAEISTLMSEALTPGVLRERLSAYHEKDLAESLPVLGVGKTTTLLNVLEPETLAKVFEFIEMPVTYMGALGIKKQVLLLERMEPATAAQSLRQMEKANRDALLELLHEDARREIVLLSSFDEEEIGSKMTTNYIAVPDDCGVREAMRLLVEQAADHDNISTVYVVSSDGMLVGAITLKDLIVARANTPLRSITRTSYPYVYTTEPIEDCVERLKEYSEDSIPVLDFDNRLCGILTSQEVTQLVDEILGEDYAKLAGLSAEEDLREPLRKSVGKRLPWLLILLGLGLVVSGVVGLFEAVVAHLTLIVSFQSLILDMAGNVGTQSLGVTLRVLMDETLDRKQKIFLIGKEARVGLTNGTILGVASVLIVGGYLILLKGQTIVLACSVAACTGAALLVSVFLSSICGTVIPILFKKLKIDPAVASGPLITTINDLVAVVSYYGLAWILLIRVLQM